MCCSLRLTRQPDRTDSNLVRKQPSHWTAVQMKTLFAAVKKKKHKQPLRSLDWERHGRKHMREDLGRERDKPTNQERGKTMKGKKRRGETEGDLWTVVMKDTVLMWVWISL